MLLILAEKNSAAKAMATAFGGSPTKMTGSYKGKSYMIMVLRGHLLEFVEPHEMVDPDYADEFHSWQPGTMPWNVSRLNWKKKPIVSVNKYTNKKESTKPIIMSIKTASANASEIVIATDNDPSGEGDLLAWEVINAIGWHGPVSRMYFADETATSFQAGIQDLKDRSNQSKDGNYVKAFVRSRFDFISMQLTRIATSVARTYGYNAVVRNGRLKSVITKIVADQLDLIKNYKKTSYFEAKFKDDKNNVYSRKVSADEASSIRFLDKAVAQKDLLKFKSGTVVKDSVSRKHTAPGALLDISDLTSILATKGYKTKEVMATYQKMYEATIVSYPRTEDKYISLGQFNQMLPLISDIAKVVNVDSSLLTHKSPRKTHVKEGGAHGANRPGVTVPSSLKALEQYGKSGPAIYKLLAMSFLSIFGEDYEYDSIKGHIKEFPEFVTTVSVPVKSGFKSIFDAHSQLVDDDDETKSVGLGSVAKSFVFEGSNKKPTAPTQKWLSAILKKYNVGTGATRASALVEVTTGKTALLTESKGKLGLTPIGEISAVLLQGSYIGDVKITETLFTNMASVGEFKMDPNKVISSATALIKHDKNVFIENGKLLNTKLGNVKGLKMKTFEKKDKITGVHVPTGKTVSFNEVWSGHTFTEDEQAKLLNGDKIEIEAISAKTKSAYTVSGKLEEQDYKGKPFWGFKPEFKPRKKATDMTAKDAPFKPVWGGYTFTKDDEARLRNGDTIEITTAKGKVLNVTFEITEYLGNKYWGIVPHFD